MGELKIVVTGAAGFVGSVLCARAVDRGHSVIGVDDLSRGLNPVTDLPLKFVEWDCRAGLPIGARDVDAVVHLAAATGSLDRPLDELRKMNVDMTRHVYYSKAHRSQFFWPTTSLALGVPDSPYVISKEEAFAWVRKQENATCLRFFNQTGAYGPFTERRKNEVHIFPLLAQAMVSGEPFVINGSDYDTADGTPSRDFTSVVDTADYILYMIEHPGRVLPAGDGAVWCGTGHASTVGQVVRWARNLYGKDIKIVEGPRRAYDTGALRCSFAQAFQMAQCIGRSTHPKAAVESELTALIPLAEKGALEVPHGVTA